MNLQVGLGAATLWRKKLRPWTTNCLRTPEKENTLPYKGNIGTIIFYFLGVPKQIVVDSQEVNLAETRSSKLNQTYVASFVEGILENPPGFPKALNPKP